MHHLAPKVNIHDLKWDEEILKQFDIPRAMLPAVKSNSEVYAQTQDGILGQSGSIPIAGAAGDQQAATFGQACFAVGQAKNTYGTGCFLLMNTGEEPVASRNNLLTTIGWSLNGKITYCLEGSVFIAGAVVQYLRDSLRMIAGATESEQSLCRSRTAAASTSSPRSPVWARPTGTPMRAARCSA